MTSNSDHTACECDAARFFEQATVDTNKCQCKSGYKLDETNSTCIENSSTAYAAVLAILCAVLATICATVATVFVARRKAATREALIAPEVL